MLKIPLTDFEKKKIERVRKVCVCVVCVCVEREEEYERERVTV
jgi:hypothetical protein